MIRDETYIDIILHIYKFLYVITLKLSISHRNSHFHSLWFLLPLFAFPVLFCNPLNHYCSVLRFPILPVIWLLIFIMFLISCFFIQVLFESVIATFKYDCLWPYTGILCLVIGVTFAFYPTGCCYNWRISDWRFIAGSIFSLFLIITYFIVPNF